MVERRRMITMDRLLCICEDWALYMKSHDSHKLGYPSKSIGMSSGGESTADAFEDMVSAQDLKNVHIVDAIIHSLPQEQQDAIYARFLRTRKPFAYEFKLDLAFDNLLTMASRRINA